MNEPDLNWIKIVKKSSSCQFPTVSSDILIGSMWQCPVCKIKWTLLPNTRRTKQHNLIFRYVEGSHHSNIWTMKNNWQNKRKLKKNHENISFRRQSRRP